MDSLFYERLVTELRQLLEDEQAGLKPRNLRLAAAVYTAVKETMDEESKLLMLRR